MLSKSRMVRKIGPFIAQHIPKSWDSGDSKRTWRFGQSLIAYLIQMLSKEKTDFGQV